MLIAHRTRRTLKAGFTLIELLAVMLIIGILATFLVPQIPAASSISSVCSPLRRKGCCHIEGEPRCWYLSKSPQNQFREIPPK